jgi:hypothetical protein
VAATMGMPLYHHWITRHRLFRNFLANGTTSNDILDSIHQGYDFGIVILYEIMQMMLIKLETPIAQIQPFSLNSSKPFQAASMTRLTNIISVSFKRIIPSPAHRTAMTDSLNLDVLTRPRRSRWTL